MSKVNNSDDGNECPITYDRRRCVCGESIDPEKDDPLRNLVHKKTSDQTQMLKEILRNNFLFQSLEHKQLTHVAELMYERHVKARDVIITQGEDGDHFFVIENGKFEAVITDSKGNTKSVKIYENKGSFGELALLYNEPRAATVTALTDGVLWVLDRKTFKRWIVRVTEQKRKSYEIFISSVPILKELNEIERLRVSDALVPRYFKDGELIIKKGDNADGMYFIEEGEVIVKNLDDTVQPNNVRLVAGQYFGEVALIHSQKRIASVYAVGNVKLAFLNKEAFERLLGPCVDIMRRNIKNYKQPENYRPLAHI